MQTRNRQVYTRDYDTVRPTATGVAQDSYATNSDFDHSHLADAVTNNHEGSTTFHMLRQRRYPAISDMSGLASVTRRIVDMKANKTGRSVRGGGAYIGKSTSPCSQSGMDPDLPRGKSSQLHFDMMASDK